MSRGWRYSYKGHVDLKEMKFGVPICFNICFTCTRFFVDLIKPYHSITVCPYRSDLHCVFFSGKVPQSPCLEEFSGLS